MICDSDPTRILMGKVNLESKSKSVLQEEKGERMGNAGMREDGARGLFLPVGGQGGRDLSALGPYLGESMETHTGAGTEEKSREGRAGGQVGEWAGHTDGLQANDQGRGRVWSSARMLRSRAQGKN